MYDEEDAMSDKFTLLIQGIRKGYGEFTYLETTMLASKIKARVEELIADDFSIGTVEPKDALKVVDREVKITVSPFDVSAKDFWKQLSNAIARRDVIGIFKGDQFSVIEMKL